MRTQILKKTPLAVARRAVLYAVLSLFIVIFAFPFYYVFVLATQHGANMYTYPPHVFFSVHYWDNILLLFDKIPFGRNFFNSVAITGLTVVGTVFFCTMGGFSLSKYSYKGQKIIFSVLIATIAIPPFLNIIPFFKMMVAFGWYNTWWALIIPALANPFGIFLMTQFLKDAIPEDLLAAARIDGLSEWGILFRIVFPLAKAGVSVLGIVVFVGTWNNFLGALILLPDANKTTIPVALSKLFLLNDSGNQGALMAGNSLALIPLLIVFLFFSNRIISNLTAGSLKG